MRGIRRFIKLMKKKQVKEREAMRRLSDEFGEFVDLHESIENYENQADEEAKFVYAVDKLISMINVYQDNGRSLRKDNVSLETVKRLKSGEFEGVPEVKKLYEDLIEVFAEEKDRLFNKNTSGE
ncbi:MAG: hypothetical protein BRC25_02210 [Parcubacteria group bacterium SW_6_46_9]|nr:MAG: hypothetical protein BRC25_02210 [Parcubacteria group bacterium SW_6_46_9]